MSADTTPTAVMPASASAASGTKERAGHHLRRFRFDRPQKIAALLLLLLLGQCVWHISRTPLTESDYQYARCGREMWERPSPIAGYFTSCGNIHDGVLAYRMAGLPLTLQRLVAGQGSDTSTWEMRHELSYVRLLLRFPFTLAALLLGGALWWVTRRLFGNAGGFVALAFYCVSPAIVAAGSRPNAEITTALGIFAAIYTAIGVAHAMQGPRRKWRPRIVLLAAALALVAASHSAALLLTLPLGLRLHALPGGAQSHLRAHGHDRGHRRRISPALCLLRLPSRRSHLLLPLRRRQAWHQHHGGARASLLLRRCGFRHRAGRRAGFVYRDLALTLLRQHHAAADRALPLPLVTTGVFGQPWLWALPFLMTFVGGVFADAVETRHGRIFRWAIIAMVALQALLTIALPALP